MEGRRVAMLNCVPGFAQGTDILLVHNDILCLGHLSSLLSQYSFRVTATNQASAAIDIVCQQEGRFQLVMAKANMPDMSTISFLNTLLLKHITVIFIWSGEYDGGAMEAFDRGYCYLLQEPIQSQDLISLWQQIYNSNTSNLTQEIHTAKSTQKVHESSEDQDRTHNDVRVKKKGKRAQNSNQEKLDNDDNNLAAEMEGEETREHNDNYRFPQKKPRISWTSDLHHKFVQAISVLGENNIRPKLIQEIMSVPYLTCRHIASHLQKFKSEVRRLQDWCKSSNFRDRTQSSSSIKSQCRPGYPNENQSQSHFPVSFSGTEDLEAEMRGGVPDALMDKNQDDIFGNGFNEDDSSQNCEIQRNPNCTAQGSHQVESETYIIGRPLKRTVKNHNQTSTEYNISGYLEEYCDTALNSRMLRNAVSGDSSSSPQADYCNNGSVRSLKAKPCYEVGGTTPDALVDHDKTLSEHNDVSRILGDDSDAYGCFGNAHSSDDIVMLRSLIEASCQNCGWMDSGVNGGL